MASVKSNITSNINKLTKKQTKLAKYIYDNLCSVALMNAPQIAAAVGVSEATLTRFVYSLGYDSFSNFHRELRIETQGQNNDRYPFRQISYEKGKTPIYRKICALEQGLMDETMSLIDPQVFDKCVELIGTAESVILVGGPIQQHLIRYFADYLTIFRENVHVVNQLNMEFFGNLTSLNENTVAFVISYPRYPKETLKIISTIASYGTKIIAITDSDLSPVVKHAKYTLITPLKYILFVEPIAAATSIIHSLLIGLYLQNKEGIKARMKKYEEYILISDMFEFKDYNFVDML